MAFMNIIYGHIEEEGGFSHPGLSDAVYMGKAVLEFDAKKLICVSPISIADWGEWF
jgi:hypothetical protein